MRRAGRDDRMSQQNLTQIKSGEVAERARKAGVENIDQMNKDEMIQEMGRGRPQWKRPAHGGGHGDAAAEGHRP